MGKMHAKQNATNQKETLEFITFLHVCELVFGVDVFDLDLGVQIDSVEQPVQSNSVVFGNMSHRRTSAFNDHFDHCFIVFKNVQLGFEVTRFCAGDNVVHLR